jgi:hypothetical protein
MRSKRVLASLVLICLVGLMTTSLVSTGSQNLSPVAMSQITGASAASEFGCGLVAGIAIGAGIAAVVSPCTFVCGLVALGAAVVGLACL